MDRVCAWCGIMLEEDIGGPDTPKGMISHGICDECKKQLMEEDSLVRSVAPPLPPPLIKEWGTVGETAVLVKTG